MCQKEKTLIKSTLFFGFVENVYNGAKGQNVNKKYPQPERFPGESFSVDIVHNYFRSRFSPIFTTSPAPIVINRSPFVQFFRMKFSISAKEGK